MSERPGLMGIVLECPDPGELAEFYCQLMGWTVYQREADWFSIGPEPEFRPRLAFQRAPGYKPPVWPDAGSSMQIHLDFKVDDLEAAEKRALQVGASRFAEQPNPEEFIVMADPVGHVFCVCLT